MNTKPKPLTRIAYGAFFGALFTLVLIVVMSLGDILLGLPFLTFDFFDWFGRILPGDLLTTGIDLMVDTLIAIGLGQDLSTVAKTAEHSIAVINFILLGAVVGAIIFYILGNQKRSNIPLVGIIGGIAFLIPLLLISSAVNVSSTANPLFAIVWFGLLFILWGRGIAWVYQNLFSPTDPVTGAEASVVDVDRRQFMIRVGGSAALLTLVGGGLSSILMPRPTEVASSLADGGDANTADLPNANDTVQAAPGTRPEITPLDDHYRIDISSRPPVINADTWVMPVTGLVENPTDFTLADLQTDFESFDQYLTLSCISNRIAGTLISTTKWTGLRMVDFLEHLQPTEDAVAIKIMGADDFDEYVLLETIKDDPRVMLCYAWDDKPLKQKHGFPLRIYIPDHYGMKQPKWITEMEFVDAWQEGYWVRRNWSRDALVNTVSVVDTVATNDIYEEDGEFYVPVGGIAYSGAKQISKVEVSIDGGEWEEAQLRQPISNLTWVVWRYDWKFQAGEHSFAVRCYDGEGNLQSEEERGVRPDGATGIHSLSLDIAEMEKA